MASGTMVTLPSPDGEEVVNGSQTTGSAIASGIENPAVPPFDVADKIVADAITCSEGRVELPSVSAEDVSAPSGVKAGQATHAVPTLTNRECGISSYENSSSEPPTIEVIVSSGPSYESSVNEPPTIEGQSPYGATLDLMHKLTDFGRSAWPIWAIAIFLCLMLIVPPDTQQHKDTNWSYPPGKL